MLFNIYNFCIFANVESMYTVMCAGFISRIMNSATSNNGYFSIITNIKIVVNKVVYARLCNNYGDMNAFVFDVALGLIAILFIVSLTISFTEEKIIRVEEENRKLEDTVKERTKELQEEKNRSEELLLNILPEEVAKRLAFDKNAKIADKIENASVLFADIVGFTKITSTLDADTIVGALNALYSRIDERAKREGIEKIKTIGDSYMAASGLFGNEPAEKNALALVNFAHGNLVTKLSYLFIGFGHLFRGQIVRGIVYLIGEFLFIAYLYLLNLVL